MNGSTVQFPGMYDENIELLWVSINVRGRQCYVGAAYHPPKAVYPVEELYKALEESIESLLKRSDDSLIVLAGDFNQMPSSFLTSIGLVEVFDGPTHAADTISTEYTLQKTPMNIQERSIHWSIRSTRPSSRDPIMASRMTKSSPATRSDHALLANMLHC